MDGTFDLERMGRQFAEARTAKNLSGAELSYMLGRSRGYMKDVEKGRANISIKAFYELCHVLELDPKEFFD